MSESTPAKEPSNKELYQYGAAIELLKTITLRRQILYSVAWGWDTATGVQASVFGYTPHEIRVARDEMVEDGILTEFAFINANSNAQKAYRVIEVGNA